MFQIYLSFFLLDIYLWSFVLGLFFNKVAGLVLQKKDSGTGVFLWLTEISRWFETGDLQNTQFTEHVWATASSISTFLC